MEFSHRQCLPDSEAFEPLERELIVGNRRLHLCFGLREHHPNQPGTYHEYVARWIEEIATITKTDGMLATLTIEQVRKYFDSQQFVVIVDGDKLAGCCKVHNWDHVIDPRFLPYLPGNFGQIGPFEIGTVIVTPQFRGLGLGKEVVRGGIELAERLAHHDLYYPDGKRNLIAVASKDNMSSIKTFINQGWQILGYTNGNGSERFYRLITDSRLPNNGMISNDQIMEVLNQLSLGEGDIIGGKVILYYPGFMEQHDEATKLYLPN